MQLDGDAEENRPDEEEQGGEEAYDRLGDVEQSRAQGQVVQGIGHPLAAPGAGQDVEEEDDMRHREDAHGEANKRQRAQGGRAPAEGDEDQATQPSTNERGRDVDEAGQGPPTGHDSGR